MAAERGTIEPGTEHPMLSVDFEYPEQVDTRTSRDIVIGQIGAEAMVYTTAQLANGSFSTQEAWDYAGDVYDTNTSNNEIPMIDGSQMPRHRYQAWFMLTYDTEEAISKVLLQENIDPLKVIREAEEIALKALSTRH